MYVLLAHLQMSCINHHILWTLVTHVHFPLGHRTKQDCPGNLWHDAPRRWHTTTPHIHININRDNNYNNKKTKQNQQKSSRCNKKVFKSTFTLSFFGKKILPFWKSQETQCAPGSWKERCHRNQRPWRGTHWVTQGVPGNDCVSIYIHIYIYICTYLFMHYSGMCFVSVCYLHICTTQNIY